MLVDTHCHLDQFSNPGEIVTSAAAEGVERIIAVGMHVVDFQKTLALASKLPGVHPALGIHPEEVQDHPSIKAELGTYIDCIRASAQRLVAIAEIGLDHHFVKDAALWPLEETIFQAMLDLAEEFHLPVSLHVKGAEASVLNLLANYSLPAVAIHWFSGPDNAYRDAIERGYFFSIPQAVRYSPRVQMVARDTPLDQLLFESDGPANFQGTVGEPKDCALVAGEIAAMRLVDRDEIEQQVEENTRRAFPRIFL